MEYQSFNQLNQNHILADIELYNAFVKYQIPFDAALNPGEHREEKYTKLDMFNNAVLKMAGLTLEQIRWILYGVPEKIINCSYEELGGWSSIHAYQVDRAVEYFIRKKYFNQTWFLLGFDLTQTSVKQMCKLMNVEYVGDFDSNPRLTEMFKKDKPDLWSVYANVEGDMFSMHKAHIKPSGTYFYYMSCVFSTPEKAFEFTKKFFGRKTNQHIKEMKMLDNFGGVSTGRWLEIMKTGKAQGNLIWNTIKNTI